MNSSECTANGPSTLVRASLVTVNKVQMAEASKFVSSDLDVPRGCPALQHTLSLRYGSTLDGRHSLVRLVCFSLLHAIWSFSWWLQCKEVFIKVMEVLVNYLEADNVHLHHCQHCQRRRCFQPINPCALALKMIGSCHKHGQPATCSRRLKKSSSRLGSSLAILSSNQHVFQPWNSNHELRDRWRKLLQTKMTGAHTMPIRFVLKSAGKRKRELKIFYCDPAIEDCV